MPKSSFEWCLENQKRVKKIEPNEKKAKEHIEKAKHNLVAADYNLKGHFDDWAVSQAYYAMYHALLAILFRKGFESRNHECTISVIKHLIDTRQIGLDLNDLYFIRTTEQMTSKDAKSLREEFQYGTKIEVNKAILNNLLKNAKEIVEKIEIMLYDM